MTIEKYIVYYKERSDGPQCNHTVVTVVESEKFPTESWLMRKTIIVTGNCMNVSYPCVKIAAVSGLHGFVLSITPLKNFKNWKRSVEEAEI